MRTVMRTVKCLGVALTLAIPTSQVWAAQHLWFISEIFTNADGTVQFVEFVGRNNGQTRFDVLNTDGQPHMVTTASGSVFRFDSSPANGAPCTSCDTNGRLLANVPGQGEPPTLDANFLLATSAFALAAGNPQPDFIIPDGFIDPSGDAVIFIPNDNITTGAPADRAPPGAGLITFPINGQSVNHNGDPSEDTTRLLVDTNGPLQLSPVDATPAVGATGAPCANYPRNFRAEAAASCQEQAADADGDGVADGADNCPNTANVDQMDSGGVGGPLDPQGAMADGIGDACQCGDVNNDGRVNGTDGTLIARSALGLPPFPGVQALPGIDKCDVGGTAGCNGVDATLVKRGTLGLPPGLMNVCPAF